MQLRHLSVDQAREEMLSMYLTGRAALENVRKEVVWRRIFYDSVIKLGRSSMLSGDVYFTFECNIYIVTNCLGRAPKIQPVATRSKVYIYMHVAACS